MTHNEALQCNIDAAQRELDGRAAQGEDVSHLRVCQRTSAIIQATAMILSAAQAEAVYSAMCALNNVGARIEGMGNGEDWHVAERYGGLIVVTSSSERPEHYATQSDFATAYGLKTGA